MNSTNYFIDGYSDDSSRKRPFAIESAQNRPPRTVQEIDETLKAMDKNYSAVFRVWIKKQENIPASITYLCRLANEYPLHQIILVLQWLIEDWKLKSIIILVANITLGWKDEKHLGLLVKGLAERWKAPYISELASSVMERWDSNDPYSRIRKEGFLKALMRGWTFNQISNLLMLLEDKVPWEIKASLFKWYHLNESQSPRDLHFAVSLFTSNQMVSGRVNTGRVEGSSSSSIQDSSAMPPRKSPAYSMISNSDNISPLSLDP